MHLLRSSTRREAAELFAKAEKNSKDEYDHLKKFRNFSQEGYHQVRAAQRRLSEKMHGVHLVAADPWLFPQMNMMTDDIHYSQYAYNLIGETIARQIYEARSIDSK